MKNAFKYRKHDSTHTHMGVCLWNTETIQEKVAIKSQNT